MKDKQEQIDQWRHAYEISEESRKIGETQIEKLIGHLLPKTEPPQ